MFKAKPVIFIIGLCFVILPLIGIYFDQKGIGFRQQALKELNQRIVIDSCKNLMFGKNVLTIDSLKGSVWVLFDATDIDPTLLSKIISTVYNQNSGKKNMHLVTFGKDDSLRNKLPDYFFTGVFLRHGEQETFDCLKNLFIHQDSFTVNRFAVNTLIIDPEGRMRRGYEISNESSVSQLIRHMTILLPEFKREIPQLIRQDGY